MVCHIAVDLYTSTHRRGLTPNEKKEKRAPGHVTTAGFCAFNICGRTNIENMNSSANNDSSSLIEDELLEEMKLIQSNENVGSCLIH